MMNDEFLLDNQQAETELVEVAADIALTIGGAGGGGNGRFSPIFYHLG